MANEPVQVISPSGQAGTVDADDLTAAVAQGYRLAQGAEAPAGEGTLGAWGLGALRGLTLGLSDIVARPFMYRGQAEALRQLHPVASGVGEAGGTLAGLLVPGLDAVSGPALAAKAGEAAAGTIEGASALGRIGKAALSGGAYGALAGAGNALSEDALGDHRLNAQKLVASVGLGGLLGSAGGALAGSVGEAASAVLGKAGDLLGSDTLQSFANVKALKAAGAIQKDLKKMTLEEQQAIGEMLLRRGHVTATTRLGDAADSIGKDLDEQGQKIGDIIDRADEAANAQRVKYGVSDEAVAKAWAARNAFSDARETGGFGSGIGSELFESSAKSREFLDSQEGQDALKAIGSGPGGPDYRAIKQRISDWLSSKNPLEQNAISGSVSELSDAIDQTAGRRAGFKAYGALNDIKGTLQAKAKWVPGEDSAFGGLKRELAGVFRDSLDTQLVQELGPDLGKEFVDAKDLYGQLAKAHRFAEDAANRVAGNRGISLTDYLGGGFAGMAASALGIPHGLAAGVIGALANKAAREYGNSAIAALASKIGESPALSTIAESFAQKLSGAAPLLGTYGAVLANAAARSPAEAMATHIAMANSDPQYQETALAAGLPPDMPEHVPAQLERASGLTRMHAALSQFDQRLTSGIDRAMRGGGAPGSGTDVLASQDFGSKRMRRDDEGALQQRADEISRALANPQDTASRISANLGEISTVAPQTAAEVAATAQRALTAMQPFLPPPNQRPGAKTSHPQLWQFATALQTVQDPLSALDHAASGRLTKQQANVLGMVYPDLKNHIANGVATRMAEGKTVPVRQRIMLHFLTGLDVDGSLNPTSILRTQSVYATQPARQQAGAAAPSKDAAKLSKLSQRMALPWHSTESLERD